MAPKLADVALRLFERPGPALLAAGGCTMTAACRLPTEHRAPFDALHQALRAWFPAADAEGANRIYGAQFAECMDVCIQYNDQRHPSDAAMTAAYMQMRCVLSVVGRVLPGDGFYDMGREDFVDMAKRAARSGTSSRAMAHRFERLLAGASDPWATQCEIADRMAWERPVKETTLPARLRAVALHLSSGGQWQWREFSGLELLHVPLEGGAVSLRLDEVERASLAAIQPGLASEPSPSA